jgi:hypothetical protein
MPSSGMVSFVALVRIDVSVDRITTIIRKLLASCIIRPRAKSLVIAGEFGEVLILRIDLMSIMEIALVLKNMIVVYLVKISPKDFYCIHNSSVTFHICEIRFNVVLLCKICGFHGGD